MKNTEDLNKEGKDVKKKKMMTPLEKEDYKALNYFTHNTRDTYNYQQQECKKTKSEFVIDIEIIRRLEKAGYIDFSLNWEKFYNTDYLYTKKGLERYNELREIRQKYVMVICTIVSVILSLLNILIFLKGIS